MVSLIFMNFLHPHIHVRLCFEFTASCDLVVLFTSFEEYCYRYYVYCDVPIYDGLILCFSFYPAELLWHPCLFGSFYRKTGSVSLQS